MGRQGNSRHWAITGQGNVQSEEAGTPKEPQIGVMEPRAQGHGRYQPSIRLMKDEAWGVFLNSSSNSLSRHQVQKASSPLRLLGEGGAKGLMGSASDQEAKAMPHFNQT